MLSQNSFCILPKESIANLLNLPSSFGTDGQLVCQHNWATTITLFDYLRAESSSNDKAYLEQAKRALGEAAKQFET
jgi:hypothetical protein